MQQRKRKIKGGNVKQYAGAVKGWRQYRLNFTWAGHNTELSLRESYLSSPMLTTVHDFLVVIVEKSTVSLLWSEPLLIPHRNQNISTSLFILNLKTLPFSTIKNRIFTTNCPYRYVCAVLFAALRLKLNMRLKSPLVKKKTRLHVTVHIALLAERIICGPMKTNAPKRSESLVLFLMIPELNFC